MLTKMNFGAGNRGQIGKKVEALGMGRGRPLPPGIVLSTRLICKHILKLS